MSPAEIHLKGNGTFSAFLGEDGSRRAGKSFCGSVVNHAEYITRAHARTHSLGSSFQPDVTLHQYVVVDALLNICGGVRGQLAVNRQLSLDVWQTFEKISTTTKKNLKE